MGRGGVTLLERLLPWLERTAPGAFGFIAKFLVEIAGGLVVVVIVGVLAFLAVAVLGGNVLKGIRRHEAFPMTTGVVFVIASTVAAIPTAGRAAAVAAFIASFAVAIQTHPRLVEIRDNARARELPEHPTTDPSGQA